MNQATKRFAAGICVGGGVLLLLFAGFKLLSPSPAQVEYQHGSDLMQVQMYEAAQKDFQTAIRLNPHYPPPYRALAMMAQKQGSYPLAAEWWRKYLHLSPHASHAWCRLALTELESGQEVQAYQDAHTELKLSPQCPRAALVLGEIDVHRSEAAAALLHLQTAAKAYPNQPQVQLAYARVLALTHQYDDAAQILHTLLSAYANHPDPYVWLGYVYARRSNSPQDWQKAETFLRQGLAIDPVNARALFELGRLRLMERQYAKAIPLLQQAAQYKRHFLGALYTLAQAQQGLHQTSAALQTLKEFRTESDMAQQEISLLKSCSANPKNPAVYLALGQLEIKRQEPRAALIVLQTASKLQPGQPQILLAIKKARQMLHANASALPSGMPSQP